MIKVTRLDDSELVLTYRQWNYNGKWLFSEAPFVPTPGQPVTIPLEPGGETTVTFQNAGSAPATPSRPKPRIWPRPATRRSR